jgi:hypothetical protein
MGLLATSASAQAEPDSSLLLQPQGLSRAGIYALREVDPSLTGQGVRMGVVCRSVTYDENGEPQNDYQPNIEHACFDGAALSFDDDAMPRAGISAHATGVCSILFGEDADGTTPYLEPFLYQGAVPAAEGRIFEFWHFVQSYVYAQLDPDIDVLAASFGWPFEDWWTRGIESLAEHTGLPVVAGIGNGTNASDPVLYPAAGSNAIGVGVVSSVRTEDPATNLAQFALAYPQQSSLGPTADGRCKPDLIAPGNCLVATADGDVDYLQSGDWSSFATPVAAGVVGMLVQVAQQDASLQAVLSQDGGNSAIKAILMNSAIKLPYWHKGRLTTEDDHEVPLDYVQGAGMVNAVGAYEQMTAGQSGPGETPTVGWDLNEIDRAGNFQRAYRMIVDDPADKVLTATLTWQRHYSQEYPFDRIAGSDSDLRLELWGINPADSDEAVLLDYCDSTVDNVEYICFETVSDYCIYEVVVSFSSLDEQDTAWPCERYAVAWNVGPKDASDSIFWHDLNADGIVDELDFALLLDNCQLGLRSPDSYVIGDINMDGVVDADDLESLFAERSRRADWYTATN